MPNLVKNPAAPVPVTGFGVPDGTVLYDGVCVLCSAWFHFVAARDPGARFRFTAIQSRRGRQLAVRLGIDPDNPQSNALILNGQAHLRSESALHLLRTLPGGAWAGLRLLLPRAPRDWRYDRIARNRYRLFGRTEQCMIPRPELKKHLLPDDLE